MPKPPKSNDFLPYSDEEQDPVLKRDLQHGIPTKGDPRFDPDDPEAKKAAPDTYFTDSAGHERYKDSQGRVSVNWKEHNIGQIGTIGIGGQEHVYPSADPGHVQYDEQGNSIIPDFTKAGPPPAPSAIGAAGTPLASPDIVRPPWSQNPPHPPPPAPTTPIKHTGYKNVRASSDLTWDDFPLV